MTRNNEQGTKRWARVLWTAGGAVAMGAVLAIALPERASAGDDFERGFKRELGAIAAQEVVGIGRHILVGAVTGHHGHAHVRYDGHRHDRARYDRHRHGHRHDRVRHHRHGHRHDRVRHHRHGHRGDTYRPYRYSYRYDYRPYRGERGKRWHRHHHRPRRVVERHYYHGPSCGH